MDGEAVFLAPAESVRVDLEKRAQQQHLLPGANVSHLEVLGPAMQVRFETYEYMYEAQYTEKEQPVPNVGRPIWDLVTNTGPRVTTSSRIPTILTHGALVGTRLKRPLLPLELL